MTQEITLEDLEEWATEDLRERMDVLRVAALIQWVHDLAGFKF